MKETERKARGGGRGAALLSGIFRRALFFRGITQLPAAATMESKARFRGCRNQVSRGSPRGGCRGPAGGAWSSFALLMTPRGEHPPQPHVRLRHWARGLSTLTEGATWRPPGRLRLSGPCLCTCSAPCVDPGSSLPPLSPDPLQGRLRQSWPQPPPVCRNGFLNVPVPESNPHPSSLLPWAQWVFPASMKTPLGAPSCPPHSRAASPSLGPYPEGSHQSPGPDALPPLPPSPPPVWRLVPPSACPLPTPRYCLTLQEPGLG